MNEYQSYNIDPYKRSMLQMMRKLIGGEWDVPTFRKHFYLYYLEEVPESQLNERDSAFFSSIQQTLDWTDENPAVEDKKYGWMTHKEYIEWVRQQMDLFESGKKLLPGR